MSQFMLPQQDSSVQRKKEIQEQGKLYSYNNDIGLPLIEKPSPVDANKPDWTLKIFRKLIELRTNVQSIYDESGLRFQTPRPVRDLNRFVRTIATGGNPGDYFTPDLGLVTNEGGGNRPKSFDDYINKIFIERDSHNRGSAPLPDMANVWLEDETFAYNFIAGPNPNQLQQYTDTNQISDFKISQLNLGSLPEFAGDDLQSAMRSGRVYVLDRSDMKQLFSNISGAPAPNATPRVLHDLPAGDWKYIYAPYAAFAVQKNTGRLLPIAIQCGPSNEGHRLYTPRDGQSWLMARFCVLAAHNNHHEVISHLGVTHLLVDPIVMATRKHLHPSHPIAILLNPHFEGTADINTSARTSLIMPDKSVDRLVGSKIEANYSYLKSERLKYSFRQNFLPERLRLRGLANTRQLPHYPYRDDGLLLWGSIRLWVSDYVSLWYKSEADIRADYEIQNWANEIHTNGKVRDFCRVGGGVQGRDDLIDMLTMTIFTAGPQHAAVNFSQGIEMIHVPSNPLAGYRQAPMGLGHTEKDVLDMLPPLDVAVHTWSILGLLAGVNNTRIGDYRGAFVQEANAEGARQKFLKDLTRIEKVIDANNQERRKLFGLEYVHLKPSRIPASINI